MPVTWHLQKKLTLHPAHKGSVKFSFYITIQALWDFTLSASIEILR